MNSYYLDNEKGRFNQALQKNSNMIPLNTILNVGKSVCKIETGSLIGSGFFIKLTKGNEDLYCLMTNRHVITRKMIQLKQNLNILYDNLNKNFILQLDVNKRFIRVYDYMNLDVTIVEILSIDNVNPQYFLLPFMNYQKTFNDYLKEKIYIVQYPLGQYLQHSEGSIVSVNEEIEKFEFIHNASTQQGSSGSPIFLKGSLYVLGIHKQGSQDGNYAHFIFPIIYSLLKDNYKEIEYENGDKYAGEMINNKREGFGKFHMKNGEYYIGKWHNDNAHGFGKQYYPERCLKYKGNFVNNEYNGYGLYIFENEEYYEGFFKNSMANGKGTYHYINGDLYEGEFFDNIKQGQGKFICSNGNYYMGQWRNDMQNGYGEYYEDNKLIFKGDLINGIKNGYGQLYKNGSLEYDGHFIDDKYDGEGSLYDSSNLYFGEWKAGQKNGHGEDYFNEGDFIAETKLGRFSSISYENFYIIKNNIRFDSISNENLYLLKSNTYKFIYYYNGEFKDGKKNGKGKLYYCGMQIRKYNNEKILIFEGEWKNGVKHGEGKDYYLNGSTRYKGQYFLGYYNVEGEFISETGASYKGNFYQGQLHGYGILSGVEPYKEFSDSFPDLEIDNIKEYEGEFVHNKKEGLGTAIYNDGSRYQGIWMNDKYNGEGTFYKENGEYISGLWENGKKNGKMTLFDKSGKKIIEEEFEDDKPVNCNLSKKLKAKFETFIK